MEEEGFILEFQQVGQVVKVTAIDPVSLREVSTMGPVSTPQSQLARLAVQKLKYVLAKDADR